MLSYSSCVLSLQQPGYIEDGIRAHFTLLYLLQNSFHAGSLDDRTSVMLAKLKWIDCKI